MTENLPGLELFLSSEKAVEGAKKFTEAVESAARAVERIGVVVENLDKLLDRLGEASKAAGAPLKKTGDDAKAAGDKMKGAGDGAEQFGRKLGGLGSIARFTSGHLTGLVGAFGGFVTLRAAINVISDTEDKLRVLASVTDATASQMEKLSAAANALSVNSRFSFGDATQTLINLTKAGATAEQAIVALPVVSDLARAGLLSLSQAGDTVIQTMAQFGLTIDSATKISDVLVKAADSTIANVDSLADSLVRVGPAGKELGISLETVTAALARLQQAGVPARVAGTGLAEIFKRLADPVNGPEGAAAAIKSLNLSLDDVHPRNFLKALDNLAKSGLTLQDATALVGTEFDLLLTTLVRDRDALVDLDKALQVVSGDTAKKASATVGTLGDSIDQLSNARDRFLRESGKAGLSSVLKTIADTGRDALNVLSGDAIAMEKAGTAGIALANAVKGAGVALGLLAATRATQSVIALGGAVRAAGLSFGALSAAVKANPIGLLITTAVAAGTAFAAFGDGVDRSASRLARFNQLAADAEEVGKRFAQIRLSVLSGESGAMDSLAQNLKREFIALEQLSKAGPTDVSARRFLEAIEQQAPDTVYALKFVLDEIKRFGKEGQEVPASLIKSFSALSTEVEKRFGVVIKSARESLQESAFAPKNAVLEFLVDAQKAANALKTAYDVVIGKAGEAARASDEANKAAGVMRDGPRAARDNPEKARADALSDLIKEKLREVEIGDKTVEQQKELKFLEDLRTAAFLSRRQLSVSEAQALYEALLIERERVKVAKEKKQAEASDKILRDLRDETDLIGLQGAAREALQKRQEVLNALKDKEVDKNSETYRQALADLDVYEQKLVAQEQLNQARKEEKRGTPFERLEQEEQLLRTTGEAREKLRTAIDAENEARQAGLKIGSAEYQDFVRRKIAAVEFARSAEELGSAFAEVVQAAGTALSRLIIDMENGRDVAKAFLQDLSRLALQRFVTNPLVNALGNFGASLASGGGSTAAGSSPSGGAATISGFSNGRFSNMLGGVIPAMGGTVVDDYGILQRGGKQYSYSEGGATTPEAIFPLQRDSRGRLGIVGADGGGGSVINMSFPSVRTAQDARAMRATIGQQVRQLRDADRRGRRGLRPRDQ